MPQGGGEERGQMPRPRDRCVPTLLNQPVNKTVKLRPPNTRRFFVGRQKIFTRRLVCGEFRQFCNKIGACRAISDSARSQNVLSGLVRLVCRGSRVPQPTVTRLTWTSVFSNMADIDSTLGVNAVSVWFHEPVCFRVPRLTFGMALQCRL